MSKKTLFFFTSQYPYGKGESFIENEIKILCKKFNKIYIFPFKKVDGPIRETPKNIEVVNILNLKDYSSKRVLLANLLLFLRIFLFEFKEISKIKKYLLNYKELRSGLLRNIHYSYQLNNFLKKIDLSGVIFYSFWFDDWATILSILKLKKIIASYCSRVNGFDLYYERRKIGIIPFRNFQLKFVKRVFAVSRNGLNYLLEKYPKFTNKFELSHLGVFDNGLNPFNSHKKFIIVSCSNMIKLKRVNKIVEILSNLPFETKWIHFGDGNQMDLIKEKAEALPNNINFELKGQITNKEILNYYRDNPINLFVHLSESEGGAPVALQEAASFGIPLLGTNVGGIPDIVNKKTGILIPKNFDSIKVSEIISNFKVGDKNTIEFRNGVKKFWNENFYAKKKYDDFCEKLKEE